MLEAHDYAYWCGRLIVTVVSLLQAETERERAIAVDAARVAVDEFAAAGGQVPTL